MNIPTIPTKQMVLRSYTGSEYAGQSIVFDPAHVDHIIQENLKFDMIKLVRSISGYGLMQSKSFVESGCYVRQDLSQGLLFVMSREKMWDVLLSLPCFKDTREVLNNEFLDHIKSVLYSGTQNTAGDLQGALNRFKAKYKKMDKIEAEERLKNYPANPANPANPVNAEYPKT